MDEPDAWEASPLDDIDLDISFDLPIHLTLIGYLPPELLLNVAKSLSACDVPSLALVCCRLRPIAEEVLYDAPEMSIRRSRTLVGFHQTMAGRTDLANRVSKFKLMLFNTDTEVELPARSIFPYASLNMPTILFRMQESLLGGLVLNLLPSLKHLTISANDMDPVFEDDPLKRMFGPQIHDGEDLTLTRGFARLEHLRLENVKINWALCRVPTLKGISISQDRVVEVNGDLDDIPNVRSIETDCSARLLIPGSPAQIGMGRFLSAFTHLHEVSLTLHSYVRDWTDSMGIGDLSVIVLMLLHACSTLEILILSCPDGPYRMQQCFGNVASIGTLTTFANLRVLHIHYEALFSSEQPSIDTILPPTIEELTIEYPREGIIVVLADLDNNLDSFPSIRIVHLQFSVSEPSDLEFHHEEQFRQKRFRFSRELWYGDRRYIPNDMEYGT